MSNFKRGEVFEGNIPAAVHTEATPPPSFMLQGKHKLVMLHDHNFPDINPRMALVVPITSAKAEVDRAMREGRSLLSSYIPLYKEDHPFLAHDSYVSTAQIMPINREWLHSDPVGILQEDKLREIDYQVIVNIGLMETVMSMAQSLYQARIGSDEAAATKTDQPNASNS